MTAHVACPQCGGPVPLRDERWTSCAHCRVPLALDLGRFLLHEMVRPRLRAAEVPEALARFLRDAEVGDAPRVTSQRLAYVAWYVVPARETTVLVAGSPDVDAGGATRPLRTLEEGVRVPFDGDSVAGAAVAPRRSLADAVAGVPDGRAEGARLVHVPVWRVSYEVAGDRHAATIDAVTGDTAALSLPPAGSLHLTSIAIAWMVGAGTACAVIAAVLPGILLPLAVYAVLGFAAWGVLQRREMRGSARR